MRLLFKGEMPRPLEEQKRRQRGFSVQGSRFKSSRDALMGLVVVDVLELLTLSSDGRTASLSSFLPSPFALVPSSCESLASEAWLLLLCVPAPSCSCQPLVSPSAADTFLQFRLNGEVELGHIEAFTFRSQTFERRQKQGASS